MVRVRRWCEAKRVELRRWWRVRGGRCPDCGHKSVQWRLHPKTLAKLYAMGVSDFQYCCTEALPQEQWEEGKI